MAVGAHVLFRDAATAATRPRSPVERSNASMRDLAEASDDPDESLHVSQQQLTCIVVCKRNSQGTSS